MAAKSPDHEPSDPTGSEPADQTPAPGPAEDREKPTPPAAGTESAADDTSGPGAEADRPGPGEPDEPADAADSTRADSATSETSGRTGTSRMDTAADTKNTAGNEVEGDAEDDNSEADDTETPTERTPYSPALIATAVALPIALVVAVVVAAGIALRAPTEREPLVLGAVPAPQAEGPACSALIPALPAEVGEFTKSTLVEPAPPATRAWQRPDGGEPIVLRCGLERPLEFNRASPIQMVNQVQWFEVRDQATTASTWFAVDRGTYIALTIPDGSGPTPLQVVSDTITAQLPAQPLDPGELPN
ncbi:DUF3515 family protein [Nocardia donostiensis]